MRMRLHSPMLTISDTAPIVQKLTRLPTAPNTRPSAKPHHATTVPGFCIDSMIARIEWSLILAIFARVRMRTDAGCR